MNAKWLMWGLLLPIYFFAFFHRTSTSTVAVELAQELGLSGALAGMMSAMYFYIYGVMQLPSGMLADSVGPRRLASTGGLLMGGATIAFAFSHSLGYALATRALIGFGAAFIFIPLLRIQVDWFEQREFPLITGLTVFVGTSGALVGVGPFAYLAKAISWQTGYIVAGVITVATAVVAMLLLRDRPPATRAASQAVAPYSALSALKAIALNRCNYLTLIAFGFGFGGYMTFASLWGVPFLVQACGIPKLTASTYVTFLPIGVMVGSLLNGAMVRVFGSARRAVITLYLAAAVLWALIAFVRFPAGMAQAYPVCLFLLGFTLSSVTIVYTTVRQCNAEHMSGTALAFTNTGGILSVAVLQPLTGWMLDLSLGPAAVRSAAGVYPYEGFRGILALFLALHIIALAAYCFTPRTRATRSASPPAER